MLNDNDLIDKGLKHKLIKITNNNRITYTHQKKEYNFQDPEERVRAITFLDLIINYKYPVEFIDVEFSIQRGSKKKAEACDIVIFNSKKFNQNNIYLIVETKKPDENEFDNQVYSYVTATTAKWFFWTNSNKKFFFKTNIGTKKVTKFTEVWNIPNYNEKLGRIKKDNLKKPEDIVKTFKQINDYIYVNANIKKPDRVTTNMINLIFCKIYDELSLDDFTRFSIKYINDEPEIKGSVKELQKLFEDVKNKYSEIFSKNETIEFNDSVVFEIISQLQNYSLLSADIDTIGNAFEIFTNKSLKEDNGQFFTPRNVISFMVNMIKPSYESKIIDPACGSGGFLTESLKFVSNEIKLKMKNRLKDNQLQNYIKDIFTKNFYGIDQEKDLVKITKAYMSIVGDGTSGVFCENSLDEPSNWSDLAKSKIKHKMFDVLFANPPFGKDIKVKGKFLKNYHLAKRWDFNETKNKITYKDEFKTSVRPSILFIEQCFNLLKDKGSFFIILPVGDLSNKEDFNIHKWLLENVNIKSIVQLPSETFQPYCGTQVCLLYAEKKASDKSDVFMAVANKIGKNQRGKPLYKRDIYGELIFEGNQKIIDDDLTTISKDYDKFLKGNNNFSKLSFKVKKKDLNNKLLPNFHKPNLVLDINEEKIIRYENLEDLCIDIYTPPRTARIYVDKEFGVPFLSGTNITQYIPQNLKFISRSQTKDLNKYIVNTGDIVITRVGTMGIIRLISDDLDNYAVSDNINIIKVDKNKIDPEYIYAMLQSNFGFASITKISKGSVQHYNDPRELKKINIPIYKTNIYKKIVNEIKLAEKNRVNAINIIQNLNNTLIEI